MTVEEMQSVAKWSIKDSEQLYHINGWGEPYFKINERGHIEVDPRRVLPRKGVIEDWYVMRDERGRGTGKALMTRLLDGFRTDGCQVAESGTWAFNEGARKAHAKSGFIEIEVKFRQRL